MSDRPVCLQCVMKDLSKRAAREPLEIDLSDYGDEFVAGWLKGQEHALATLALKVQGAPAAWSCTVDHRTEPCGECAACRSAGQGTGDPAIVSLAIRICTLCLDGKEGECHSPGCLFWMCPAITPEQARRLRNWADALAGAEEQP